MLKVKEGRMKKVKFENNQFKYGFDYKYELKVYDNIGKYKRKKY